MIPMIQQSDDPSENNVELQNHYYFQGVYVYMYINNWIDCF